MRTGVSGESCRFWDGERLRFFLRRGPDWLRIDENAGHLFGTPETPGESEVEVAVVLESETRLVDEEALAWGRERVLSCTVEKKGEDTQTFRIEVAAW